MNRARCHELLAIPVADLNSADALRMLDEAMKVIEDLVFGEENFQAAERLLERWEASFPAGWKFLSRDEEAWKEGFAAGNSSEDSTMCPYAPKDSRTEAWILGYMEGCSTRLGFDDFPGLCLQEQEHAN